MTKGLLIAIVLAIIAGGFGNENITTHAAQTASAATLAGADIEAGVSTTRASRLALGVLVGVSPQHYTEETGTDVALSLIAASGVETCWKDAEGQDDGVSKACWYKCVEGHQVMIIASTDRCPISVKKGHNATP